MPSTFDVPIAHTLTLIHEGTATATDPPVLLVFINGLMLPRALWQPTLTLLPPLFTDVPNPVFTLTYDRYGQGESRLPSPWTPKSHDLLSAAHELDSLLTHILPTLPTQPNLIFISHSIGVPLARLHNTLPKTAHLPSAHLFLDSNITTTDFISLLPDPTDPTFSPATLPPSTTLDDLAALRARTLSAFHPTVPNAEALDRTTISTLVPSASSPPLRGPPSSSPSSTDKTTKNHQPPHLTIIAHSPAAFAAEGLRMHGTPVALNEKYIQPAWDENNAGLLRLSAEERVRGVVVAEGAGHFVQRDNPACVADEVVGLVRRVVGG